MNYIVIPVGVTIGGLLTVAMLFTTDWDRPPLDAEQIGFRGIGMEVLSNPRKRAEEAAFHEVPAEPWELELPGPDDLRAGEAYENVQVLGDLGDDQFNRLMTAITEWVSPEQGCAYCHNEENFAEDSVYTKIVARRMIQMTQAINSQWQDHVGQVGVTCYTCHRGQPVPKNHWFTANIENTGMAGYDHGQNKAVRESQFASLPYDPLTPFLLADNPIRVQTQNALPTGENPQGTMTTEWTYSLMNHMSVSLGVGCTYCHNSRAFGNWEQSPPQRVTAWHGIRMARAINVDYIEPLGPYFPESRVGELGDAAKTSCATCHNGIAKPLNGAPMAESYPSLLSAGN